MRGHYSDSREDCGRDMISARHLTKRYGDKSAVDDLSFTVPPGVITGFLGPNGAGKSTTMRMILGLDAPTSGSVLVNGLPYAANPRPLHEVGALLEARAVHTGRSARNHLLVMAATTGVGRDRVEEVIELVGLADVAGRRVGSFSLGMGQRLGIAAALLADPQTLILDEPVNGLDPDGIRWIRQLLKRLAEEGRTVFLSSHLMSEMALTADHVIVVGRGGCYATSRWRSSSPGRPRTSSGCGRLRLRGWPALLATDTVTVRRVGEDTLEVKGLSNEQIGTVAASAHLTLFELTVQSASLEEAYMALTAESLDFASPADAAGSAAKNGLTT